VLFGAMGQVHLCSPEDCDNCRSCRNRDGQAQDEPPPSGFSTCRTEDEVDKFKDGLPEVSLGLRDLTVKPETLGKDHAVGSSDRPGFGSEELAEALAANPHVEEAPSPPKKRPENAGEPAADTSAEKTRPESTEEPTANTAAETDVATQSGTMAVRNSRATESHEMRQFKQDDHARSRRSSTHSQGGKRFPKRPFMCKLSQKSWDKLKELYEKMDTDGSNCVTREKALEFFSTFKKVSAEAMFNEVDTDKSGAITADEFMDFWIQVRASGYSEELILEEIDQLMEGGAWVDWKDNRSTSTKGLPVYPKRPILCRLSKTAWSKLQELFLKISGGGAVISRSNAMSFFKGSFSNVSTEAMFHEVDTQGHGCITVQEWVQFWIQVRSSGYREKAILDEVELLLEGGTWVDWKDGRNT